jgi:hypothetical protein
MVTKRVLWGHLNITTLRLEMNVGLEESEESAELLELDSGKQLGENITIISLVGQYSRMMWPVEMVW